MNKIQSVLYRFILIIYSALILLTYENLFSAYIYFIVCLCYLICIYFSFKYYRKHGLIRLVCDYALITLVLYGKDISYYINFTLFLLPIINSVNHTGKIKLFSFTFGVVVLLSLYVLNQFDFEFEWLIPLTLVYLIQAITLIKEYIIKSSQEILETINTYFEQTPELGKAHKIFKKTIEEFNDEKVTRYFLPKINNIGCFRLHDDKLTLLSSYPFIKNYTIVDESELVHAVLQYSFKTNHKTSVDEELNESNIWFKIQGLNSTYFFCFQFPNNSLINILHVKLLKMIFLPFIRRVANVIDLELDLNSKRLELFSKLKVRAGSFNKLNRFIHFLNNNLTPIKNYFDISTEIGNLKDDDPIKQILQSQIVKEREKAIQKYREIELRAKRLGDKASNPAFVSTPSQTSLKRIYSIIRKMWETKQLSQEVIYQDWQEDFFDKKISISIDDFEYVLDEIINNIIKHREGDYNVSFHSDTKGKPAITFTNHYSSDDKAYENLKVLKRQFNLPNTNEVLHRSSHGMYIIKDRLDQMKIYCYLQVTKEYYSITMSFNPSLD